MPSKPHSSRRIVSNSAREAWHGTPSTSQYPERGDPARAPQSAARCSSRSCESVGARPALREAVAHHVYRGHTRPLLALERGT